VQRAIKMSLMNALGESNWSLMAVINLITIISVRKLMCSA